MTFVVNEMRCFSNVVNEKKISKSGRRYNTKIVEEQEKNKHLNERTSSEATNASERFNCGYK